MRKHRILTKDAWYEVRMAVNDREPLFWRQWAVAIFYRVFGEAGKRFAFELRELRLEEERLSFYIKPADGLQLPAIMQWVKQTFAVRFNRRAGRTEHVWGDRYWSMMVEGEPPEWAGEVDWAAVDMGAETGEISFGARPPDGVSPLTGETPAETGFSPQNPAHPRSVKPPNPAPIRAESPTQPPHATPPNNGHGRGLPASQLRGAPLVRPASQKANADALFTPFAHSGSSMTKSVS